MSYILKKISDMSCQSLFPEQTQHEFSEYHGKAKASIFVH